MSEPITLVKKLAEVMAAVERIPKRGFNSFHNYAYATEADIAEALRAELAKRHVLLIPSITGETRHPVGDKGSVLTVLEMEMEFLDGESGQSIKKPWRGYGTDKDDKGGYKAMTGGEKYFLLKTFLMPTGDDPEAAEPQAQPSAGKAQPTKRQASERPVPPARPPQARGTGLTVAGAKVAKEGTSGKGPWRLHVITFSDGREAKTFSTSVFTAAQEAMKSGTTVEVDISDKGDLVHMLPVRQLEEAPF